MFPEQQYWSQMETVQSIRRWAILYLYVFLGLMCRNVFRPVIDYVYVYIISDHCMIIVAKRIYYNNINHSYLYIVTPLLAVYIQIVIDLVYCCVYFISVPVSVFSCCLNLTWATKGTFLLSLRIYFIVVVKYSHILQKLYIQINVAFMS